MCELYHCTPSELDEQSDGVIEMHIAFLGARADEQHIQSKRAEQKARAEKALGK